MKRTKHSLLTSCTALLLCFVMLVGTTFAWFTDIEISKDNVIQAGNLDVDLMKGTKLDSGWSWEDNDGKAIFNYEKWEPGYITTAVLAVQNNGNLSAKWSAKLSLQAEPTILADVIDIYVTSYHNYSTERPDFKDGTWQKVGTVRDVLNNDGLILPGGTIEPGHRQPILVALHMRDDAGNQYQGLDLGSNFDITIIATQASSESDSFDNTYDENAKWPQTPVTNSASAPVTTDNDGILLNEVTMTSADGKISATLPVGTKLEQGIANATLKIKDVVDSDAKFTLAENEAARSIDVHIDGVADGNSTVMTVRVKELLPKGLNMGNHRFYHVENGNTIEMHLLENGQTPVHNNYEYDPATGDVVLYLASFSEVAVIAEPAKWEGKFDYNWYNSTDTYFEIANADQLAAFGAIVGGMKVVTDRNNETGEYTYSDTVVHDSFEGKTIKLVADINIGDLDSENGIVFYPIGYWNDEGTYEKSNKAISSGFYSFSGTFDGNGNTISDFYQNTWEMKGDHNWYAAEEQRFRDGMGLFGKIYGGTVKNLTVKNFSSDGEITTTGVIAAYADGATFENIAIFNCNPRVYNIGNGGIVGCVGWYAKEANLKTTFTNITVDNSNKISALWGSYDVSCGGILGQYYPTSGQSSAEYPVNGGVEFKNCHVSAIIDVNNDVCANYQYYWYRYSGMLIGNIRATTKDANGYTIADTTGVTVENCTYTLGDWNEYWYCELVANSLASYTHDHQFSRLTKISSLSEIQDANGNWTKTGNYVIPAADNSSATCYHIMKNSSGELYQHFHDVADESNPNIYESFDLDGNGLLDDLKEDRQCYFMPFNQIFNGNGYGVKAHYSFGGITEKPDGPVSSEEKFTATQNIKIEENEMVYVGDLFTASGKGTISSPTVQVYVSPVGDESTVSAIYSGNSADWFNGTLTFSGIGMAKITITDYFYCTPTTIIIQIAEHQHVYDNACDTTCNDCGEEREITHNYTPAVTAPTCTTAGYTTYTCSCGNTYVADETDALGHSYNTVKIEPTCTTGGYTTYTCSVCNHSYVGNEVAATGHKYNAVVNLPTCTSEGYTTYTCSCGDSYVADQVAKLDHTYNAVVTSPTCTEVGYTTYTCSCGDTYVADEVAALGHSFDFESKFNGDFLYRVGNQNEVALSALFNVNNYNNIQVEIASINGASGTYNNKSIQFTGTGIVKVTVTDTVCGKSTVLNLEVVDATNVTTTTNATDKNIVLLNDCGLNSITISGRYTFFGNGFTATYTGDGRYLNNGLKLGVINVSENGTLDNLRIEASIYPTSYLYFEEAQEGPKETETAADGTVKNRYYYQLSAVSAKDNATISNCYIYGGRNNIFVNTGNVTITDTILECGTLANIQIQSNSSHTVTLNNVTTIQHRVNANIGDTTAVMMGAGIVVGPDTSYNPTIVLNGNFKQYNWVTAADKEAITNSTAKTIIQTALDATAFNHTVNGATSSNLGIVYMNQFEAKVDNNTGLPYAFENVTISPADGMVYSLKGANESQIYSDYANADKSTVNGWYEPQFKYDSTLGGQNIAAGGDEHCYRDGDTIKVMFPSGDMKEIDLSTLVSIDKYTGQDLGLVITVKDSNGNDITVTNGKITLFEAGEYTATYTVTDTLFYDKDGKSVAGTKTYSWNVTIFVSLKDKAVPNAYYEFDSSKQTMGYKYKWASFNENGNVQFLPFLAGLKIYDYNGQNSYLRFDGDNDFSKIASATITEYKAVSGSTHVYIKVVLTDGGVINVDTTARASSGSNTYTGTLKTSGNTLYYVNDGYTNTTTTYWVISNYSFTGNNGVEVNSGSVTFNNCAESNIPTGAFGTTIKYTVTYDANGGDCGQTLGYATSASSSVTLPTPSRSGYTFKGWYTAASGGTRVGGAGDSYTPSANVTLYAQWGAPVTITFNTNGGKCNVGSVTTGSGYTLPEATRDGYTFKGWFTASSGGEKVGDVGETYSPINDITLYAQWIEIIIVTYNANGGSCSTASQTYKGEFLILPTPTTAQEGYHFAGWYTAVSGGDKIGDAGATYDPSKSITLYARWEINTYTITVSTSNATITGVTNNQIVTHGTVITINVTYSQSDGRKTTVNGTEVTLTNNQYTFKVTQNTTIHAESSRSCVTGDTMVTLADGSKQRIDSLTGNELVLAWDFYTGRYAVAPIAILKNHGYNTVNEIKLVFSDGTEIKTLQSHGFFDVDEKKFVEIDESNVAYYIGHEFVKYDADNDYTTVTLVDYTVETRYTEVWSILAAKYYDCVLNDLWTLSPADITNSPDYFMPFEMGDNMKFDDAKMHTDIEKYGLFTYEDFAEYCTYEEFVAFGFDIFKVSIGKGAITWEQLMYMINVHLN